MRQGRYRVTIATAEPYTHLACVVYANMKGDEYDMRECYT